MENIISGIGQGGAAPEVDTTYQGEDESDEGVPTQLGQAEDCPDDGEPPGKALSAANLQSQLRVLLDCTKLRTLETTLRKQCNWDQLEILRNCRHAQASHTRL